MEFFKEILNFSIVDVLDIFLVATLLYYAYKLLKGTVTLAHLQLWTKQSLFHVVDKAGLKVKKYVELNEFTMKPEFYLAKMGITNKIILFIGKLFYKNAKKIASNKIQCILVKK